ncbi:MAG TPA: peptide chain release factor N(5)-glutamine methyltransferase [Actinobacteria bacterium]|nr:peptide chain release factor N(5)-glutamine methyltransferase [Actinomycetota bacterium]
MTTSLDLLAAVEGLPRHEAERLLAAVTGRTRSDLVVGCPVRPEQRRRFLELVERRVEGAPLQYLEGTVVFGPVELVVDPRVLVPRPETEELFELACTLAPASPATIVDLCTGSGNLAVALAATFPDAAVYATDRSGAALAVAAENVRRNRVRVRLYEGDLFEPLPADLRDRVELLVANPPYVAEAEWAELPVDVRDHEPRGALVAGPRGDEVLRRIGAEVAGWLAPGGLAICEIGAGQARAALDAFAGLRPEIRRDLAGRPRFVVASR